MTRFNIGGLHFSSCFQSDFWTLVARFFFTVPTLLLLYDPTMRNDNVQDVNLHCPYEPASLCGAFLHESAKVLSDSLGSLHRQRSHKAYISVGSDHGDASLRRNTIARVQLSSISVCLVVRKHSAKGMVNTLAVMNGQGQRRTWTNDSRASREGRCSWLHTCSCS